MQAFPHHYTVSGSATADSHVTLELDGSHSIESAAPVEFGGPGDHWSPESLLVAAVADCFVLSFRAVAGASRFDWRALRCIATGMLDRTDGVTRFTDFDIDAVLTVGEGADSARAVKLLHKAEQLCLVTNSLTATTKLTTAVRHE